jgi:N-acetylneuraminate synthase
MAALMTAFLLGARVIEKHFTHDKTLPGNDHYHAMDSEDLKHFLQRVTRACELIGPRDEKICLPSEATARKNARRSLVLAHKMARGEILTETSLIPKRPGTGISPAHWDELVGLRVNCDLEEDTILQWRHLEAPNENPAAHG